MSESRLIKIVIVTLLLGCIVYLLYMAANLILEPRNKAFQIWLLGDSSERETLITVQKEKCDGAPFILPADGFIGLLYGDPRGPYSASNPHQGIDIFSNTDPGITPVYAAYDGYLTREPEWKSSLILRLPDDPLNPGNQVWLYYTHMANQEGNDFILDAFPPGTNEKFIQQGTLLGYTGDYNGSSLRSIWVHLHFSIVKDDGRGGYLNELQFENTLDPSPYLGLPVNYVCAETGLSDMICSLNPSCS